MQRKPSRWDDRPRVESSSVSSSSVHCPNPPHGQPGGCFRGVSAAYGCRKLLPRESRLSSPPIPVKCQGLCTPAEVPPCCPHVCPRAACTDFALSAVVLCDPARLRGLGASPQMQHLCSGASVLSPVQAVGWAPRPSCIATLRGTSGWRSCACSQRETVAWPTSRGRTRTGQSSASGATPRRVDPPPHEI